MHSETFYATAAQIFPALLIALFVEAGSSQRAWREYRDRHARTNPARAETATEHMRFELQLTSQLAVVFLAGEVIAALCLGFRWFNLGTFTAICLCILVISLGLILTAVNRLSNEQYE